jgi:hypothetical protein
MVTEKEKEKIEYGMKERKDRIRYGTYRYPAPPARGLLNYKYRLSTERGLYVVITVFPIPAVVYTATKNHRYQRECCRLKMSEGVF